VTHRHVDLPSRAVQGLLGIDIRKMSLANLGNEADHPEDSLKGDEEKDDEERRQRTVRDTEPRRQT
jgi:hypothetical protein